LRHSQFGILDWSWSLQGFLLSCIVPKELLLLRGEDGCCKDRSGAVKNWLILVNSVDEVRLMERWMKTCCWHRLHAVVSELDRVGQVVLL